MAARPPLPEGLVVFVKRECPTCELVVPVLASVVVIAGYIQRKVLGLPPFEDDGTTQFVAPPEKIKPPQRGLRRIRYERAEKALDAMDDEPAAPVPPPASTAKAESTSKTNPARKKNEK